MALCLLPPDAVALGQGPYNIYSDILDGSLYHRPVLRGLESLTGSGLLNVPHKQAPPTAIITTHRGPQAWAGDRRGRGHTQGRYPSSQLLRLPGARRLSKHCTGITSFHLR